MLPSAEECVRIDRLFDEIIDLDEPSRVERLEKIRAESPELHRQLVNLLELADTPCTLFKPDRIDRTEVWRNIAGDVAHPVLGERIGAWRLMRHLGCGGMGDVYEVARADGVYEQRAALKLIRSEIESAEFWARFSRERQILALLSHPGIAGLIDGGEDTRGRPFLVMEFVSGSNIDKYCESRSLDLSARLQLFLQVANAVEHAHRHRVIHRDLKPSNIVVTASGQAKLLDFGIAKVVAVDAGEEAAARTTLMITPQYSTPEQVLGLPADHRSDVYQLGLLLFELLTGQRAQEPVDATPAALLRVVCTEDRPKPSAVAAAASGHVCATIGNTTPTVLARQLRGDLDWIVQKALRENPARRYASVQALIDDLERYRRGAPILARPESLAYRASKFVRRHPWGVTSTAVAFGLMAAYAVTASLQSRVIAAERDRASTQAHTAEQVKLLVLRMFEGANPEQALGRELTAKELLDTSWPLIESETKGRPDIQVELLNTMSESHRQLGDYDTALARSNRAGELVEGHPEVGARRRATTLLTRGRLMTDRGEYAQAEVALNQARILFSSDSAKSDSDVAATLTQLGYLQYRRGFDAEAESFYRSAIALYERTPGDHRRPVADAMERLAVAYSQQSKYREAAELLEATLALQGQLLPEGHPDIAGNLANLAEVRRQLGQYADAEAMYRESLAIMERSRGPEHPYVATVMNNLGRLLRTQKRYAEAEALIAQALAIRRKQQGEHGDLIAMSLNDLGGVYLAQGETAKAEAQYREALMQLPANDSGRGGLIANLGSVLEARGELAGAERLYREALSIRRAHLGNDHDLVANTLRQLGVVLRGQGREAEADAALREALRILQLHLGAAHPRVVEVIDLLAEPAATGRG